VGSHLIDLLVQRGATVTALARSAAKAEPLMARGVQVVAGDLSSAEVLRDAARGQDVVFHVAALTAARSEAEFLAVNRDGTATVVDAVRRAGRPRLVHVSSLAAAGPSAPGQPLLGDEPLRPVTAYGRSKAAAEELVTASGLDWTIVRPPLVYGPRDTEFLRAFRAAARGLSPVFGDGSQELSGVYAPDLAAALADVAGTAETLGRTYAACHPKVFTQLEFARTLGDVVGRSVRIPRIPAALARPLLGLSGRLASALGRVTLLTGDKANEFLAPAWTADPSALERDAGWRAAHGLRAGLEGTAAWYREQRWL
jgi:nucleoside-diphosphate-sugar epimerase